MFTPIELAEYCAMIANGGTRYNSPFLNKLTDYARPAETEPATQAAVLQQASTDQ